VSNFPQNYRHFLRSLHSFATLLDTARVFHAFRNCWDLCYLRL